MQNSFAILVVTRVSPWLMHLGGLSFILVGLADNSILPLPGSMDILLIVLAAHHRSDWIYYVIMATAGATLGGYVTYRLAQKGGKERLEKKIGQKRAQRVYDKFKDRGFTTVMVGALLPPPFPIVPVLMTAGVLSYPRKKFLAALSAGRAIRFLAIGILARLYGTAIIGVLRPYYKPVLWGLVVLAVLGALAGLFYWKVYLPRNQHKPATAR